MPSKTRGIRGAITVERDDAELILNASRRLLREIVARNNVAIDDIASALFSVTPDLSAAFPALGVREMGWTDVPMMHCSEINVPGSLTKVIRVLMHVNTTLTPAEIQHVYLEGAVVLRPDLVNSKS
jgi:chorismate mutase